MIRFRWFLLAFIVVGCSGSSSSDDDESPTVLRELRLDRPPRESHHQSGLLSMGSGPTLYEVIDAIEEARRDQHVGGLFLNVASFGSAWGRASDLVEALARFREAGKPVHCYFEQTDNSGYWLMASGCDRISMTPAGTLNAVGVAAQLFYARTLLSNVGVRADVLQVGRYKGAFEPLMRDDMSDATRESMEALVDDLYTTLVEGIGTGRGMDQAAVRTALDRGPFDSAAARSAGFIDAIAFDDEARSRARTAAEATTTEEIELGAPDEELSLDRVFRALSGQVDATEPEGPHLALVHIDGGIVNAHDDGPGGGRAGPFIDEARALAVDDNVRAVVLRISSGGGSALASDRMWHAVHQLAERKPVVVSIGDMAASGGYYIAVGGTEVFAHPNSIVGSIGVVGGKADLSGTLADIGVHTETIRRGQNAAWMSPARGFTEQERAILLRSMRSTYDRFLRRVSAGRPLERAEVEEIAQGRVWSGRQGQAHRLIDRSAGLLAALDRARELGELEQDAAVVVWPRRRGFLETLATLVNPAGGGESAQTLLRSVVTEGPFAPTLALVLGFAEGEPIASALPFSFEIR